MSCHHRWMQGRQGWMRELAIQRTNLWRIMKQKKREIKAKEHDLRIREISDSLKQNNIRITGVPEEEEREIGVEGLCEQIIEENFLNLGKTQTSKSRKHRGPPLDSTKTDHHQGIPQSISQKYIVKERIIKAAREKSPYNL